MIEVQSIAVLPLVRTGTVVDGGEIVLSCGYVADRYGYMVCIDRPTDPTKPQYECLAFHEKTSEATYFEALSDINARVAASKR